MTPFDDGDIVDGAKPGGATTSHSILVPDLTALLAASQASTTRQGLERLVVEENLLGKGTSEGRQRAFRGLRELYLLDPERILFRSLRDLWTEDLGSRQLLAGLCAYARDSTYRATGKAVLSARVGDTVPPAALSAALQETFPGRYSPASAQKIARNTGAAWGQSGHLVGRTGKARVRIEPRPVATAYALLLGHLQGLRGDGLLDTMWTTYLDLGPTEVLECAQEAGRRGYLEFRSGGGVLEVTFRHLLRNPVTA